MKSSGQRQGRIDDRNVNTTDILPTIAAEVGVDELPWPVDGQTAQSAERDPADKWVTDWPVARLHAEDGDDVVHIDGASGFAKVLRADPVEATGPDAVWRRTEYGALVGTEVDDAEVRAREDTEVEVQGLDLWDDIDPDLPQLELAGQAPVPGGTRLALAVNDTVAAVLPTVETPYGISLVHALLWPEAVRAGHNVITAYRVDGPVDDPVLHPLEVVAQGE